MKSRGYDLVNIFERKYTGRNPDGTLVSELEITGAMPIATEHVHALGLDFPPEFYETVRERAAEVEE